MIRFLLVSLLVLLGYPKNLLAQSPIQLDSLLTHEKTLSDGSEKIKTLTFIGFNYSRTSPELAKYYYKKAIEIGERIEENTSTSTVYSQIANFYNTLGETDSVEYFLQKARIKAEKANNNNNSWATFYLFLSFIIRAIVLRSINENQQVSQLSDIQQKQNHSCKSFEFFWSTDRSTGFVQSRK
ncbi:hypothetical protein [Soonwooa purpurea]